MTLKLQHRSTMRFVHRQREGGFDGVHDDGIGHGQVQRGLLCALVELALLGRRGIPVEQAIVRHPPMMRNPTYPRLAAIAVDNRRRGVSQGGQPGRKP